MYLPLSRLQFLNNDLSSGKRIGRTALEFEALLLLAFPLLLTLQKFVEELIELNHQLKRFLVSTRYTVLEIKTNLLINLFLYILNQYIAYIFQY